MEPQLPGACESIISTCGFWDKNALCGERDTLAALFASCDAHHRQAKRFLACAGAFVQSSGGMITDLLNHSKLRSAAAALVRRHCPGRGYGRNESKRLLTAITPHGVLTQSDTIAALGCKIVPISDKYLITSGALLEYVRSLLLEVGFGIITCSDPVSGSIEAVIVPECAVCFCAQRLPVSEQGSRVTHCSRFLTRTLTHEEKHKLAENQRQVNNMLSLACDRLAMALAVHDELESVYVRASDFSSMNNLSDEICSEIFMQQL